jgi:hypothetical protein
MSWQITQNGNSFSGPMTANDSSQGVTGRGTVSGTVSGSSLQFSMTVPVGGFDGAYTGCTSTVSGNGTVSSSSINGTYAGTTTCPPGNAISGGTLALNKQ